MSPARWCAILTARAAFASCKGRIINPNGGLVWLWLPSVTFGVTEVIFTPKVQQLRICSLLGSSGGGLPGRPATMSPGRFFYYFPKFATQARAQEARFSLNSRPIWSIGVLPG